MTGPAGRRTRALRTRRSAAAVAAALALSACAAGDPTAGDRAVDGDPDKLIGLDPGAIAMLLGEPELRRLERPAEVWQYRTDSCVFDIFLYRNEQGPRVVHYEARQRDAAAGLGRAPGASVPIGAVSAPRCLGTLLTRTGAVS